MSNLKIDTMILIRILFWSCLFVVGLTYFCKYMEDRKYSEINELKQKKEKLLIRKKEINEALANAEKKSNLENDASYKETVDLLKKDITKIDDDLKEIVAMINGKTSKLVSLTDNKKSKKIISEYTKFADRLNKYLKKDISFRDSIKNEIMKNNSENNDPNEINILNNIRNMIKNYDKNNAKLKNACNELYEKKIGKKLDEFKKFAASFESNSDKKDDKPEADSNLLIFAAIYAVIAGLAITSALEAFIDPDQNLYVQYAHNLNGFIDLLSSNPSFVIASFFPIAIMFIHCGIIFLLSESVPILSKGNRRVFFFSALLIFLEAISLYYAGTSINNILNYSFWILVLSIIHVVWILIIWSKGIDAEPQWLSLNLVLVFFTLTILLTFPSITQIEKEVYAYVLIIFLAIVVTYYKVAWRTFWAKYDVSDITI